MPNGTFPVHYTFYSGNFRSLLRRGSFSEETARKRGKGREKKGEMKHRGCAGGGGGGWGEGVLNDVLCGGINEKYS